MRIFGGLLLLCIVIHFCSSSEITSPPSTMVDCSMYKKYPVVAIPCPITYLPVCGTNYITYGNSCLLCAEVFGNGDFGRACIDLWINLENVNNLTCLPTLDDFATKTMAQWAKFERDIEKI